MNVSAKLFLLGLLGIVTACKDGTEAPLCDTDGAFSRNQAKVNIGNGVWGTVIFTQGNCMPTTGMNNACSSCPAKRTLRIYAYTTRNDAVDSTPNDGFYDSFNTTLIKETESDAEGFFQAELPAGTYTIVAVENSKLYGSGGDGQGGISPLTVTQGRQNLNFNINYKAVY